MNQKATVDDQHDVLNLENGLDALRQSPDFCGPVESLDDHAHANDHFALIYESRAEQLSTAIPFIRQGLERDERCLYIADENSREEIVEAMRAHGIDVDAALGSGALSLHTKQNAYLRNGTFDPEDMIEFLDDAIADATEDYGALRIAGEMTWIFGDEPDIEDLIEYEGRLNELLPDQSAIALCQYNRERFSPEIIRDIIRTHPHIIHDNVVSHNVYYTPPEEFFGPDRPANEVDRMLGTLHDRTRTKAELEGQQEFLRKQNEITASTDGTFEEKLRSLFELGCEQFDLELGAMARVDAENDRFEVEYVSDDHEHFEPGTELPLSETYCTAATEIEAAESVSNPRAEGYDDITVYQQFGIRAYLGTYVAVEGGPDRTFFFISSESREREFSDDEREFLRLMGQWVQSELEHQTRKQDQQTLYEIAADTERTFDEKLQALFDLGCDRFDLELGGIARIDPDADLFEVEHTNGTRGHLEPGTRAALSETYCRVLADADETAGVTDPVIEGFDDTVAYDEFGVRSYLGTRIGLEDSTDRTLFFVSSEPRSTEFSEAEQTFQHLMGQWVKYELERKRREADLQRSKNQFERIFENSDDAIYIVDPHADEILDVNPAGREMLGYARAELLSRRPSDIHPEEMNRFQAFVDEVYEDGSGWTDELTCRRRDGTHIPVEMSASRIEYDDRRAVLAVARDISERKKHERFQRELYQIVADPNRSFDEKLQAVFDLGCERFDMEIGGIASVDPETDRFEVDMMNGDHEHLVPGKEYPLSETYCSAAVDDGGTGAVTDPVREGYEGKLCYERFGVRAYLGTYLELDGTDDRTFWFVSTTPHEEFSTVERTFQHLMGQWVKYEFERQQYERELERTVERLQQSNDRLKQFAYAASHDLQEPLRMVSSYVRLLESRYADELDEEAREYIQFAVDGADRMRAMVDDLLAYSRVERSDGEFESIDCDTALEQVTDDLRVQIDETDVNITAESLPTIRADGEQFKQLLRNLLSNAIKYSGDEPREVALSVERRSDHWEFAVTDNGIGIDPDKCDRIFEVFKRLHHEDEYSGTGIGLSLCQEIVENHGGEIWVESEPGEGSTFSFTIPR